MLYRRNNTIFIFFIYLNMNTYNDKLSIFGGNELRGCVTVQNCKNSILPIMAACILNENEVCLHNIPKLLDIDNMLKILHALGVKAEVKYGECVINASSLEINNLDQELCRTLRSSIFLLGALIARTKQAVLCFPGGCEIGARPIDIHIKGLEDLGAKIIIDDNQIICDGTNMYGGVVNLSFASVGATENLMMASVFLKGTTILNNVAKEPEIVDLQNFLNSMGCNITGAGTSQITIYGVDKLHSTQYTPMGDRIVAGTLMIATAITGGNVTLKNANFENNEDLIKKLLSVGCQIDIKSDIINITSKGRLPTIELIDTQIYPEFPTDMQAQMMALQVVSEGVSVISENVFENRYKHVPELIKLDANIIVRDRVAVVRGVKDLFGTNVKAGDLRGGAGLVLAGLKAHGNTIVEDVYHIDRGYEGLENILSELGANIKRI